MFSFFRRSQDTKKILVTEKEADGFVFLDNTTNEERNEFKDGCTSLDQTLQNNSDSQSDLTEAGTAVGTEKNHNVEGNPFMPELLSDVPFTLAPHVLAAQDACSDFPQQLLSYDVNDNLTRFCECYLPLKKHSVEAQRAKRKRPNIRRAEMSYRRTEN